MSLSGSAQLLCDEATCGEAARRMVDDQLRARGIRDPRVLRQMRIVPRHFFVDRAYRPRAYDDKPLPTMNNQTISQPYVVALMTELLNPGAHEYMLEVGTGSGYQTAILARLAQRVVSIERDEQLADHARDALAELGIGNVTIIVADGSAGAVAHAPFDGILVTAGAPQVPPPLLEQLRDGGRLVMPVGDRHAQKMVTITRHGDQYKTQHHINCRFVPLVGEHAWPHGAA